MNLFYKILKTTFIFIIGIGGFLYSLRLLLNAVYKQTYSDEGTIQLIRDHILLTIFIFVVFLTIIFIIIKIFPKFSKYLDKINPLSRILSKYESYYNLGEYDIVLSAIKSKTIFKFFKKYQYSINKLFSLTYLIEGKQKVCFESIKKALEYAETDETNRELLKIKLQLFISAGSINGASEILNSVKNSQMRSSLQTLSHFEALILEKQGNLEEAKSKLISASTLIENQNPQELFTIYNNLGRILGLLNNHSNEILYYEKAKDLIKFNLTKYQSHVIYQNLVGSYLLLGNQEKSSSLLNEYFSIIDKENKHDLLEYYNYLLSFYRQTNNLAGFINTIDLMHKNLDALLTKEEQLASNIHELRFCFNNIGIQLDLLHKIENDFALYENFDLHEKLMAYQIIFQAITSPDGAMTLRPFENMHKYIFQFFRNSFSEIEKYIKNEIEDFQVYDKCWLLEKKVWLHNFQPHNQTDSFTIIQQKLKLIDEITDIYFTSGNIIPALESKLNFVDECMGSLLNPLTTEQIQFLKEKMLIAFEKVESEIQPFLKHPEIPPSLVRLAKYSSFFDLKDLTRKYRDLFLDLNLSINHFAAWIQNYYTDVNNYLGN